MEEINQIELAQYIYQMGATAASFERLFQFLITAAKIQPTAIKESDVKDAIKHLKARNKYDVEINTSLSADEKEKRKNNVDAFYLGFEDAFFAYLKEHCKVVEE